MKRFLPSSLLGQVMISVALALMAAQILSAVLLYRAGEERREHNLVRTAAFHLIRGAERARLSGFSDEQFTRSHQWREQRRIRRNDDKRNTASYIRLPPRLRYQTADTPPFAQDDPAVLSDWAEELVETLEEEGVAPHRAMVARMAIVEDAALTRFADQNPHFARRLSRWLDRQNHRPERHIIIAAIQRVPDGVWETARVIEPPPPRTALGALLFQTLLTFGLLIVILYLVLRRITRPLDQLAQRVSAFSRNPDEAVQLPESGPDDTRRLIAAHNAMEARIVALLDEKDVMLGAIGHDLKTPLAALRVRVESVPDEAQRGKMVASIEDITETLDDILTLSRVGRDGMAAEAADLGALTIGIAEEFEDLGEDVTLVDPPRLVARVQVTWVKRALRNLVSNAVRYGGGANISVTQEGHTAILRVEDNGPGIPPDRIADMMEPFARGENSRNRATGGAGLGLTLARAIAEHHGGELRLINREEGGLTAEIRLPL